MRGAFKTDILDTVSRKLGPYVLLFGCYMISNGHISPGGGFQGGVVLASGGVLIFLGCKKERLEGFHPEHHLSALECLGYILFLSLALSGTYLSGAFLSSPFPQSGNAYFVYLLNMIIGVKVGAGVSLICISLLREE